jgi:hypothetical protein
MLTRSTLLHLRIPFSFFLMPVFCFSLAVSPVWELWRIGLIFVILHLFLYPASNGFNSFYDKDEDSIGGLKHPPKVSENLLWVSLGFDGVALLLGLFIGWEFTTGLFIFGLASKAYSWDKIRLKKYPVTSWLVAGFFQGFFTFLMVYQGLNQISPEKLFTTKILLPASLSTALLLGFYPMTQIYQHAEDARRGDMTMSRLLGIRGTFLFTALLFGLAMGGFFYFLNRFYKIEHFVLFQVCLAPGLLFFGWWFFRVNQNIAQADFENTMWLNLLSASGTNLFFLLLGYFSHNP